MNNSTYNTFVATLEDIVRSVSNCARVAVRAISTLTWPALAVACVIIALAMTLVPLALGLFILFMAVKLIAGGASRRAERGAATPYQPVEPRKNGDIKDDDIKGE